MVAARFAEAWLDGTVWPHFVTTMVEIALGFAVGLVLALVAGYGLARSALFERLASPYLVAAQAVPVLVMAPLLVLWFGPGLLSKVVICALIVFFPVAIATMVGLRSVDARLLELGRSLRATRAQVLTTLEIPAALPSIFGGLRVGVTLAVVGAVVGEWAGAEQRPGGPDQRRAGLAVRYPAHVRRARDHRTGRDRAVRLRRRRRTPVRRCPLANPATSEVPCPQLAPAPAARSSHWSSIAALVAACGGPGASAAPSSTAPGSSGPSSAPSAPPVTPEKLVVGLGFIPSVQFAQFYLAEQQGYYEAAGLDVEFQNKIDPDLITLVGQGAIDIGIGDGTSVIPAVSNGIPIRYVATIYGRFPTSCSPRRRPGSPSAADLRGQEARHARAATGRAGSCSRRCSGRPG